MREREREREWEYLFVKWLEEQINKGHLGNWHSPSLTSTFSFLFLSISSSSSIRLVPQEWLYPLNLSYSSLIVQKSWQVCDKSKQLLIRVVGFIITPLGLEKSCSGLGFSPSLVKQPGATRRRILNLPQGLFSSHELWLAEDLWRRKRRKVFRCLWFKG